MLKGEAVKDMLFMAMAILLYGIIISVCMKDGIATVDTLHVVLHPSSDVLLSWFGWRPFGDGIAQFALNFIISATVPSSLYIFTKRPQLRVSSLSFPVRNEVKEKET